MPAAEVTAHLLVRRKPHILGVSELFCVDCCVGVNAEEKQFGVFLRMAVAQNMEGGNGNILLQSFYNILELASYYMKLNGDKFKMQNVNPVNSSGSYPRPSRQCFYESARITVLPGLGCPLIQIWLRPQHPGPLEYLEGCPRKDGYKQAQRQR